MARKCENHPKCRRNVYGVYARFCSPCFVANSKKRGSYSNGNVKGNPGNAGNSSGNPGNAGNSRGRGNLRNAGNSSGNPGNAGNTLAKRNLRNAGNVRKGKVKKDAGKRSSLRRSAGHVIRQGHANTCANGKQKYARLHCLQNVPRRTKESLIQEFYNPNNTAC